MKPLAPAASPTWRHAALVLAALALLCVAGRAGADPRWWWDDARIAPGFDVIDVDVAVVTEGPLTPLVLVAFETRPTLIEGAIELTASFDGGCSFCAPVRIGTCFATTDQIAIAAAPIEGAPQPIVSIAVIHLGGGSLEVLHDAGSITLLPGRTDCGPLAALQANIRSTTIAPDGVASDPDIAGITAPGGRVQFHAVWHATTAALGDAIEHAHDLAGDGSGWTTVSPIARQGAGAPFGAPRVSLDVFTGVGASVNVAWPVPNLNQVLYERSVDSGTTFSATGAPPAGPAIVSQGGLGASGPLALDSGGTRLVEPPWHGILSFQDRGPASILALDAQSQQAPTIPSPAWGADRIVGAGAQRTMGIAASVVGGGPFGTPEATWLFYTAAPAGAGEIFTRGALLDADAATPVDVDSPPLAPVRPGDPTTSTDEQLTACALDDATGRCVATRGRGNASHPQSTDDGTNVFVTWLDDRTGTSEAWFKRTDLTVAAPDPSLTAACLTGSLRRITVSFDQVHGCGATPAEAERIRRYLIYYGTNPAGPYDDTDLAGTNPGVPDTIVVDDDGSLVDPVTVDIDGLLAGTTYFVIVVPEDQARNVSPPDFDPLADGAVSPPNERSIATPVTCTGAGPCLYRATAPTLDATGLFIAPPAANDIAFAVPNDVPYAACPFPPGSDDPQAVLDAAAPPLIYYQVEGTTPELHVAKDPAARSVTLSF